MDDFDRALRSTFEAISAQAEKERSTTTVYETIDYMQLGLTFLAALTILFLIWILFEYLAKHESAKHLFRQRLFHPKCVSATLGGFDHRAAPPDAVAGRSVLMGAFNIPGERLPSLMGPGAYLSFRLMRHCTYFAHMAMAYSILVLVPLYVSQHYHVVRQRTQLLNMLSISYIAQTNPSHMWVIVISAYIMCTYWVIVIYSEWQHVKAVRLSWEHESRSFNLQSHYSLLIECAKNDKRVDLRSYLPKLLSKDESEVVLLATAYDPSRLNDLKRRLFWVEKLPKSCFSSRKPKSEIITDFKDSVSREQRRLATLVKASDSVRYAAGVTVQGSRRFSTASGVSLDDKPDHSITATTIQTTSSLVQKFIRIFKTVRIPAHFVTLRSMTSRTVLSHMYRAQGDTFARITPAPPPSDVIWSNVTVERNVIVVRKWVVRILLFLFGITYAIPIIKIQEFARNYRPSKDDLEQPAVGSKQWLAELFCLYFPAILQVLLTQIMPRLFRIVSQKYERYKTYQDVSRFVLHRAFIFQLLTIYVIVFGELWFDVTRISGGVIFFFDSFISRIRRLGQAIPPVALYFASTVILNIVTETGGEMLNPVGLLVALFKRHVLGDENAWKTVKMLQFRYSSSMTSYLTLLNVMFTFCLISPVIVFFCWVFWSISYVWNTYAFIYLNNRRYEVGTAFSATIYSGISISLVFSQVALFFVIWSYDSTKWFHHVFYQVYAVGLLVVLLLIFKYIIMKNFSSHANEFTSLSISAEMDRLHKPDEVSRTFYREYYYQPEARDPTNSSRADLLHTHDFMDAKDAVPELDLFPDEKTQLIKQDP